MRKTFLFHRPFFLPNFMENLVLNVTFLSSAALRKGGNLSRGTSGKRSCHLVRLHQSENKVLHSVTSAIVFAFWNLS